jgi:hypothetical protein
VTVKRRHTRIEDGGKLPVRANVAKQRLPTHLLKTEFASLHGMVKSVPAGEYAVKHLRRWPERTIPIGMESCGKGGVVELAWVVSRNTP